MKKFHLSAGIATVAVMVFFNFVRSQCTIIPNAIPGITLTFTVAVNTGSGVAYNPNANLYYIAQAGNLSFPLQTFSSTGVPLFQTTTGFDMRGLWWNSNTNQLESNGYSTGGIWSYNLNSSGFALNTGSSIFPGFNQPDAQSVGDYNCVDNEIWYYSNGSIQKRNRATNTLIGNFALIGLPVGIANLNNNSVFYTDCQGHEIGLLDYVLKRIYFFDKTSMTYSGYSQLPASAVVTNTFGASWTNGMVWLFDTSSDIWYSYQVLSGFNTNCTSILCNPPNLQTTSLTACFPNQVNLYNGILATSGVGNATFYSTASNASTGTSPISNLVSTSGTYYVRYEDPVNAACFSQGSILVNIQSSYSTVMNVNVCSGEDFTFPDGVTSTNIISAETHISNLVSVQGCDSIITTNISVNAAYNLIDNVLVCPGTIYTYPDGSTSTIMANTNHTSNLQTSAGCDSIIVTNISLNPAYNMSEIATVCFGGNYTFPDGSTSFNISSSQTHISNLTSVLGCDSIISTSISVNSAYSLIDNISLCQGSLYTFPDGISTTIVANTSHTSNLQSSSGCDSIIVTNITMIELPNPGIDGNVALCSNDAAIDLFTMLGGSPDAGGIWLPSLSSGSGNFNPSIDPSGVYTYVLSNSCGNFLSNVNVSVNTADVATFSFLNPWFCLSDTDPTPILSGTSGGTYTISNNGVINDVSGTIDLGASGAGTYQVTYTTNGVCYATAMESLIILPNSEINIVPVPSLCSDDTPIILTASPTGGIWAGVGVDPTTGLFNPTLANIGTNTLTYSISGPCGSAETMIIPVTETPNLSTIGDTVIQEGQTVELTTIGNANDFAWTPVYGLNCPECQSPNASPQSTTLYTLIADNQGCSSSTQVLVTVVYTPSLYVPNVFSPNGDGNNDILYVRGQGIRDLEFVIYDRWGEKVFESTDKSIGWDGYYREKKMNPGVFVYYVKVWYLNNTEAELEGDVTLVR